MNKSDTEMKQKSKSYFHFVTKNPPPPHPTSNFTLEKEVMLFQDTYLRSTKSLNQNGNFNKTYPYTIIFHDNNFT